MIYKYYTADLKVLDGSKLTIPSMVIKTWFFTDPMTAFDMFKNQLKKRWFSKSPDF